MTTTHPSRSTVPGSPVANRLFIAFAVAVGLGLSPALPAAQVPSDLELDPVISTGISSPVAVRNAGDGSGRIFIVEQGGDIEIFDGSQVLATPFLDITTLLSSTGGEQGLLGLAFHPDYENNGFFFVNYTEPAEAPNPPPPPDCPAAASCSRNTVIARYQVSVNPNIANPNSRVRVLTINQDYSNHNGGDLHFGPDGYLYVGTGDGGSGNDPHCRAQNLDRLLGKMLRIDVDGNGDPPDCDSNGTYTVPDNPYSSIGGACDELWNIGLRNPWRFSFDRFSGDMYIGDVGQDAREEISFEPWNSTGEINYGWKVMEGTRCADPNPIDNDCPNNTPSCFDNAYTPPILEHEQPLFQAITGGFVYRGPTIGGLQGRYVYADYSTGRIWIATRNNGGGWDSFEWDDTSLNISGFGEDESGELYLISLGGTIYRFQSDSSIFGDQFESMDLSAWSDSQE